MSKDWQEFLKKIEIELRSHPVDFLSQKTISYTVHPNFSGNVMSSPIYRDMLKLDFFENLKDPAFGKPHLGFDNQYSISTIQSAYYIDILKKEGYGPETLSHITDIGAGYGNLCRSFYKTEFAGRYQAIDFPIMGKMQKKWLDSTLGKGHDYNIGEMTPQNLLPSNEKSLIIGTFSINEMPMSERSKLESFYHMYDFMLIAFKDNANFGVDNLPYFETLMDNLDSSHELKITKCPYFKNNRFLLGKKK